MLFLEFLKSRMGDRAFRYLAPLLSNELPVEVWEKTSLILRLHLKNKIILNKALVIYTATS